MKIVFMGTPEFAVPSLKALIYKQNYKVVAVCTQPDRPAGRGNKLHPSPVKVVASNYKIPVLQPPTLSLADSKEMREQLKSYNADIFVVAAYGLLLPKGILKMPPLGCINVHASLLPKYRGASPIHAALLNGDTTTGITIMHMDTGLDTGDMIMQESMPISPTINFQQLNERMSELGAKLLLEALALIESGTAPRIPQNEARSSYAPMLEKSDGQIHWKNTTSQIQNLIRALSLWPGSYTLYDGQPLKIWQIEPAKISSTESPGTVIIADESEGLLIKTGDGTAWITELQGVGGRRMSANDYLRGHEIKKGTIL